MHYNFFKEGEISQAYFKARHLKPLKVANLDLSTLPNLPPEIEEAFPYYTTTSIKLSPSQDSIHFKGKIYLLVDGMVYSAVEMFATFVKESGFATLVGTTTAGDGIGSDPAFFMLPNSGDVIRMLKELGTTSDGTCNEEKKTMPHYSVDDISRTQNALEDQCIQKVLTLEEIIN